MISEKILKLLEERSEIVEDELVKELKIHPGVVRKILDELRKQNKVIIEKKKQPHHPKKFIRIIKYTV